MARNGSGVYSAPANTTAVLGEIISPSKFESRITEIEADLNVVRPVSAGGTGGATAAAARTSLELGGKWNLAAIAAPTAGDDADDGYSIGSGWIDVSNDRVYFAVDVSSAAAVWRDVVFQGDASIRVNTASSLGSGLTIDGAIVLTSANSAFNVNTYFDSSRLFAENGYGGFIQTQTTGGDFLVDIATSQNASGAGAAYTGQVILQYDRSAFEWILNSTGGNNIATLSTSAATFPAAYTATTASAANVNVASGGQLARSTSSLKYKTDVEPAQLDYAKNLLALNGIYYKSKSPLDNPNYRWWGFAAEEVAEIDPRLVHWDDDGPQAVQYDRFVVHLLALVKDLYAKVENTGERLALPAPTAEQPNELAALKARIGKLEQAMQTFIEDDEEV